MIKQDCALLPYDASYMKRALDRKRTLVEARLGTLAAGHGVVPERLQKSISHSLLAPAKRIRAALVMISAAHWGRDELDAIDCACTVEMVHAASLILDDLPSMDNAALRRGVLTNHRVFGESTAILAAIGLLSRAFGVIAEDEKLKASQRAHIAQRLSVAIGPGGLVAGQEIDLNDEVRKSTQDGIEAMYAGKTGALFAVAAEMGAIMGGADEDGVRAMHVYGQSLGLAFQTLDDVLDAVGTQSHAGKDVRKDVKRKTLVSLLGLAEAQAQAARHIEAAVSAAESTGLGEPLAAFARIMTDAMQMKLYEARQPAAGE